MGRDTGVDILAFQAWSWFCYSYQGDVLRFDTRLPVAFIFRAVGALSLTFEAVQDLLVQADAGDQKVRSVRS